LTRDPKALSELPAIRRSALVLGLTLVAGCTDAISYLGLGRVFTANMTGNTVLLGVAVAQRDAGAAARSASALGGFVIGATVVGLAPPVKGLSRSVTAALIGELAVLAALLGWWLVAGSGPSGAVRDGLIALAGTAMGVQSAAVARLAVPGVTTTYITGTWTGITAGVATWLRRSSRPRPAGEEPHRRLQVAVVAVYLGGAVAGGFGHDGWGPAAAAIPLGVLAGVVVAAAIPVARENSEIEGLPPDTGPPDRLRLGAHEDVARRPADP
jgi:uncharacterized membrane protein YoaK (UPF0700 family)